MNKESTKKVRYNNMTNRQLNLGKMTQIELDAVEKVVMKMIMGRGKPTTQRAAVMQAIYIMCSDDPTAAQEHMFNTPWNKWLEEFAVIVYGEKKPLEEIISGTDEVPEGYKIDPSQDW